MFPFIRSPYKKARNQLRGTEVYLKCQFLLRTRTLFRRADTCIPFTIMWYDSLVSPCKNRVSQKSRLPKKAHDELGSRRITFVNSNIESCGERERRRKRVPVLSQLFCNSARMSSSALKQRRITKVKESRLFACSLKRKRIPCVVPANPNSSLFPPPLSLFFVTPYRTNSV